MSSPITNIMVLTGQNPPVPRNYTLINQDMNDQAGGDYVYLCYTRDSDAGRPITAVQVFCGPNKDDPNFLIQHGYTKVNVDLNSGIPKTFNIYLCYTRDTSIPSQVTELGVITGNDRNVYPEDSSWIRVDQNANESTGGGLCIYVVYKSS